MSKLKDYTISFPCIVFYLFGWFWYVLTGKKNHVHSSEVNKAKFKQKALWHVSHTNHHICNGDLLWLN